MTTQSGKDALKASTQRATEALKRLLAIASGEVDDAAPLLEAWHACQAEVASLEGAEEALAALAPAEREEVSNELRAVLRLNAVAGDVIRREAERVEQLLRAVGVARRDVRAQVARSGEIGASVDIAG